MSSFYRKETESQERGEKETRTDVMDSIPQEPPNHDHFTSVNGAHSRNRRGELVTIYGFSFHA